MFYNFLSQQPCIIFGGYGQGGYGIRPYDGDCNDSVNMVWHNDKFMQLNIVEIIRYFVPNPMDHHSRIIQYHFTRKWGH